MSSFKGRHYQQDIILQCVRWYVAYSLSYRDLEELMQERGYAVGHSTVQRWVVHYAPRIEKAFRKYKKRAGNCWRMDWCGIPIIVLSNGLFVSCWDSNHSGAHKRHWQE
jgi:transposase-like protein